MNLKSRNYKVSAQLSTPSMNNLRSVKLLLFTETIHFAPVDYSGFHCSPSIIFSTSTSSCWTPGVGILAFAIACRANSASLLEEVRSIDAAPLPHPLATNCFAFFVALFPFAVILTHFCPLDCDSEMAFELGMASDVDELSE